MKLRMPVALATGTVLLLVGCSYFSPSSQETASPELPSSDVTTEPDLQTSPNATPTDPLFPGNSTPLPETGVARNIVGVQILPEGLGLSTQQTNAGEVSFNIFNNTVQTQKVFVFKSSVPLEQLPIKDDALDFDNPSIQLIGQLNNGLLSAYGESVINCILEPGQYILMVYPPGGLRIAKVAIITVQASKV
ncbi:MAG TPA: hypothetical protein V6D29_01255 [Leptolyngbyaceae cyanobacterium]